MGAIFVSGAEKKKERPLSVSLRSDLTFHGRIAFIGETKADPNILTPLSVFQYPSDQSS